MTPRSSTVAANSASYAHIYQRKLPHRGANGDIEKFAPKFLEDRLRSFAKDMRICLTGTPSDDSTGPTHAYFPALMSCCGMLEYLSGLFAGHTRSCSIKEIIAYAKFLPKPDYCDDTIRILFSAFRNAIAHHGIASGVWIDPHPAALGRRITWRIHADARRPALRIIEEAHVLRYDPPWDCRYTHRVHISLDRLWRDIRDSVLTENGYRDKLVSSPELQKKFAKCMHELYPA